MVANLRNPYSFRLAYLTSIDIKIEAREVITQYLHSHHDVVLSSNTIIIPSLNYNNKQSGQITAIKFVLLDTGYKYLSHRKNPGIQK